MDLAGFFNTNTIQVLNANLMRLEQETGTQIAILSLNSLDGVPIEQATIQITDKWKLGKSKTDKGLLILISKQERALRIEVGQGLEGVLPDVNAKRIISGIIVPAFRAGEPDRGILQGVETIISMVEPEWQTSDLPQYSHQIQRKSGKSSFWFMGIFVLLTFLRVFRGIGFGRGLSGNTRYYGGGGWGGGGGFGGGSSGGGYSGGGGGFSGGGASGNW